MRLMIPMAIIAIALGVAALSFIGGDPSGACLQRTRSGETTPFMRVAERHPARLVLEYADGLRLEVPRNPQRVVSTAPGLTEMIAFLQGHDRLVAVSEHCDRPRSVTQLPSLSVMPLSVERLIEYQPDLVVLDRRLHRASIEAVRARVPAVLLLDTSRSLLDLRQSFEVLAEVLDNAVAIDLASRWSAQTKRFETLIWGKRPRNPPRVLLVGQWQPLYVMGRASLLDDLLRACGCVNVACDMRDQASGTFSEELVIERRPDWILSVAGPVPPRLRNRWAGLPAIEDDQFLDVSGRDFERAGPGTLRAFRVLADRLIGLEVREDSDAEEGDAHEEGGPDDDAEREEAGAESGR